MLGVLAQIGSSVSFGVSNALWKIPISQTGQVSTIFYRTLFSVIFLGIVLIVFTSDYSLSETDQVGLAILLSTLSFLGLYFFTQAMKHGTASLVSVAASTSFIVGQLTAVFVLGETIQNFHFISLLLFLVSIIVLEKNRLEFRLSKEIGFALLAALFWGTTLTLMAVPSKSIGFIPCSFITELTVFVISSIMMLYQNKGLNYGSLNLNGKLTIPIMGLLSAIGVSLMYLAFSTIEAYIVVALSAITHNVAVIASRIILNEPIKGNLVLSSILSTLAIIGIVF